MFGLDKYFQNRWVAANPRIFYRMLRGFFRANVLGRNTLRVIELFPTFACQSNCNFCSVGRYTSTSKKVMNLDDYIRLASDGAKMGAAVVTILGGEPLLYEHLEDLVQIFKRQGFYTHLVSNGLALTCERLEQLKNAGLDCLYFSLESIDPRKNDHVRGPGHYAKIMENIEWVKRAGLTTGLSTIMLADSVEQAEEVIKFCHEQGINASGGQIAPVGRAEGFETLSDSEFRRVRELVGKYPRLTFDWVFSYFFKPRCPAGKEKIGVTCYGDVIGCSYNPLSFGNYHDESLHRIWQRMGRFSQFSKDFPGCLSSEDPHYIKHYLGPVCDAEQYPLSYLDHPAITSENDPGLFEDRLK